jgi:hypothetical protein
MCNIAFYSAVSLLVGPVSIKALLACSRYYPDKTVDSRTGAIIENSNFSVDPLFPKIGSLWRTARSAVHAFEAKEDVGFFGKNCARVFYYWWYVASSCTPSPTTSHMHTPVARPRH